MKNMNARYYSTEEGITFLQLTAAESKDNSFVPEFDPEVDDFKEYEAECLRRVEVLLNEADHTSYANMTQWRKNDQEALKHARENIQILLEQCRQAVLARNELWRQLQELQSHLQAVQSKESEQMDAESKYRHQMEINRHLVMLLQLYSAQ